MVPSPDRQTAAQAAFQGVVEGKPRRATGPAKGEQPATAVPDSRNDGTSSSGPSPGRPALPRQGMQGGKVESEAGSGSRTTETPEDGPSAGARWESGLGNELGRPQHGQDERSGVRVTSPSVPVSGPRTGQRQEGNAAREGSSGRPPPVARHRKVPAVGGSTLAATCGEPGEPGETHVEGRTGRVVTRRSPRSGESRAAEHACACDDAREEPLARGPRRGNDGCGTRQRVSREEQSSGGRGTPWTRPAETCRGDRGRSKPPGS